MKITWSWYRGDLIWQHNVNTNLSFKDQRKVLKKLLFVIIFKNFISIGTYKFMYIPVHVNSVIDICYYNKS